MEVLDLMSHEHSFRDKAIYRKFENDAAEFMRVFSMIHTAVEIEGFTRFANTLRMIACDYHDEALYNIEEAKSGEALLFFVVVVLKLRKLFFLICI